MNPDNTIEQIVAERAERYNTLFADELSVYTPTEEAQVGISGLTRATLRTGGRSQELRQHLSDLDQIISTILLEHDQASRQDGNSLFAFMNDDSRRVMTDVTTQVFTQWELALNRRGHDFLLDTPNSTSRWLVVETAAAVMAANTPDHGFNLNSSQGDREDFASIIASWGPEYVRRWFDGSIIRDWLQRQGIQGGEQDAWLEQFTPKMLKELASTSLGNPIGALERVRHNFDVVLSDENLITKLGWSRKDIRTLFTPSLRRFLALRYSDAEKAMGQIHQNISELLSTENLASELGWDPSKVLAVFTPGIRRYFAVHNIADALGGARKLQHNLDVVLTDEHIAEKLGWDIARVKKVFTLRQRVVFAKSYTNDPLKAIEKVEDALHNELTNERIATILGWDEHEVQRIFTPGLRRRIAMYNPFQPLDAVRRIRRNLMTTFQTLNLATGLGRTEQEIEMVFTPFATRVLAANYPLRPLAAAEKFLHDVVVTLSDNGIARGTNLREDEVGQIFTLGLRQRFALRHPRDPLTACHAWLEGKLSLGKRHDRALDNKLLSMGKTPPSRFSQ